MPNDYRYLIPAVLVGVMVLIFVLLSWSFFNCPLGCEEVNGKLISVIDPNKQRSISNAAANLNTNSVSNQAPTASVTPTPNTNSANTNVNLAAVKEQVKKLKEDSEKLPESTLIKGIDKLQKEIEGGANTNTSTNTEAIAAMIAKLMGNQNSSANFGGKEELTPEEKAKKELRESLRVRYSSRVSWVMLTTLLCGLFLGIVWFAAHVTFEAFKTSDVGLRWEGFKDLMWQKKFWQVIGLAVIALVVGALHETYMPIVAPMFQQTIYTLEGIAGGWFGFFNGIVFAAVIFLVAASCAIYDKVRELNKQTKDNRENTPLLKNELADINAKLTELTRDTPPLTADELIEKNDLETKKSNKTRELSETETDLTDKYKDWRIYAKGLLYIGGAMLTVGLFRVQILNDWHIAFVDSDSKTLLEEFFKTSLYNQAVFYTSLLMAIYLPIVYALPATRDAPTVEDSLNDKGFFATLTTFAPQIITLLSPVLLAPLASFI